MTDVDDAQSPRKGARGPGDESWDGDGWDDWSDWDDDGDGFVYVPEEPSIFRRFATLGIVVALLVVLVIGASLNWVRSKLEPGGPRTPVELSIPQDATTAQIATMLEEQGIVADATVFRYYVKWQSAGPFQAGRYDRLTTNQPVGEVVERLEAGPLPPDTSRVTVPEGLWLADVKATLLQAYPEMSPDELSTAMGDHLVAGAVRSRYQPDGKPLEGFLFPATYEVLDSDRADETKLVQQMVDAYDRTYDELGMADVGARLAGPTGGLALAPYDVLIVASMVEEEAKTPADKPKIARVIYNRMLRNMTLGIDATILYGLQQHTETLTQSQLDTETPYNTRLVRGLPPTPIANPGRESLEAALNPEPGEWLYYVLADEAGNHFFTNDYDEFLRVAEESRAKGLFE